MEKNKRLYVEQQQAELRRQRGIVDRLAKENQSLRERIADQSHLAETALKQHKQTTLESEKRKNDLDSQLAQEKELLRQAETKVKDIQGKITEMRKQRAAAEQARPTAKSVDHRIEQLENQLYLTTTKYNKIVSDNGKLREEITHLRREHLKFEEQHSALLCQQEEKQNLMKKEMEEAR